MPYPYVPPEPSEIPGGKRGRRKKVEAKVTFEEQAFVEALRKLSDENRELLFGVPYWTLEQTRVAYDFMLRRIVPPGVERPE